jgi:hypothetical protein
MRGLYVISWRSVNAAEKAQPPVAQKYYVY